MKGLVSRITTVQHFCLHVVEHYYNEHNELKRSSRHILLVNLLKLDYGQLSPFEPLLCFYSIVLQYLVISYQQFWYSWENGFFNFFFERIIWKLVNQLLWTIKRKNKLLWRRQVKLHSSPLNMFLIKTYFPLPVIPLYEYYSSNDETYLDLVILVIFWSLNFSNHWYDFKLGFWKL